MTTSKMTASGKVVFFLIANLYHVELLLGCGYLHNKCLLLKICYEVLCCDNS